MSFDGIFKIYHRDRETGQYKRLVFYDKEGNELSDGFPSQDGMLNQLLLGHNRHGFDFEAIGEGRGVPSWYVDSLKKEHPDWFNNDYGWNYNPREGTYYDYLELRGWAQGNACDYKDWMAVEYADDDNDNVFEPPIRNALKDFIALVNFYLEAYNIWYPKPGDVYIICEMSY